MEDYADLAPPSRGYHSTWMLIERCGLLHPNLLEEVVTPFVHFLDSLLIDVWQLRHGDGGGRGQKEKDWQRRTLRSSLEEKGKWAVRLRERISRLESKRETKWERWGTTRPFDTDAPEGRCVVVVQMITLLSSRVLQGLDSFFFSTPPQPTLSSQDSYPHPDLLEGEEEEEEGPTEADVSRFFWLLGSLRSLWTTMRSLQHCRRLPLEGTEEIRLKDSLWSQVIHLIGGLEIYCANWNLYRECMKLSYSYERPPILRLCGKKRKRN